MRIYKVKQVAKTVGLSKKKIKSILFGMQVITKSWAVKDGQSLIVELHVDKTSHTETTPYITEAGVNLLKEISAAREANQLGFIPEVITVIPRVITAEMVGKFVNHVFGREDRHG